VLAAAIAILFFWRRFAAGNDYDLVNMHDASGLSIAKQEATAKQLAHLDRIMTILVVVTVVYGLAIGGYYVYDAFINGGKLT
jgi:ACR3 family arsenite efflux pump ArsB